MRFLLVYISLFFAANIFAQAEKKNSPVTIRGNIGIPRTVSSKMFRTAFNGVYEGNISVNARLFSNFYAGVGYQNSHHQNNKQVFVFYRASQGSLSYNTRLDGQGGFVKIGYDKFFDKGYMSYSLNTGYMALKYKNVNADTTPANKPFLPQTFGAPFVQPELSVNFMADGRLGFSIMLSYTTLFYKFDPRAPRFNQFAEVNEKSNRHAMSWINIGFGFTVHLGKK